MRVSNGNSGPLGIILPVSLAFLSFFSYFTYYTLWQYVKPHLSLITIAITMQMTTIGLHSIEMKSGRRSCKRLPIVLFMHDSITFTDTRRRRFKHKSSPARFARGLQSLIILVQYCIYGSSGVCQDEPAVCLTSYAGVTLQIF